MSGKAAIQTGREKTKKVSNYESAFIGVCSNNSHKHNYSFIKQTIATLR